MRRILSTASALGVALASVAVPGGSAQAAVPVDLQLVLAIDVSGSIDAQEAQLQRNGYLGALTDPEVIRAIRGGYRGAIAVAYVEWSGAGFRALVADWTEVRNADSAKALAAKIAEVPVSRGTFTSISGAIDFSVPMFDHNGFEGGRRVIDISGDGANNAGRLVTLARDAAVAAHITINGLPIVNDKLNPFGHRQIPNLDLYYQSCVIGGPGAFMEVAKGFGAFAQAIRRKLISEIAGRTPVGDTFAIQAPATASFRPRIVPVAMRDDRTPLRFAARQAPPCDIGERMFERRMRYYNDN